MPINPNIALGVSPMQLQMPNPDAGMNALAKMMQVQGLQDQSNVNALQLRQMQRAETETNALNDAYRGALGPDGAVDRNRLYSSMATSNLGSKIPDIQKKFLDADTAGATLKKTQADTQKAELETALKKTEHVASVLSLARDPISYATIRQVIKNQFGQDLPEQFDPGTVQAMVAQGQTLTERLKAEHDRLTLGETVRHNTTVEGETGRHNRSEEGLTARGQNLTAKTSRDNNADTIKKDYVVAGFNPDGTPGTTNDAMIDAIGQYKVAPPNGMALRNPRMQQILSQVAEKYPNFDATQYGARQTAAKSFSTGKDAQNVQAANTALNHLETVEQLALAQKNGDIQLFNKVANTIAAQTGQPAPTNLRAAISMVAPELTKAVVGAAGGVGERADFAHNLNPNGSPQQILQGVGTIKELLGGRLSEVQRTYERTTGRKDFGEAFLSPAGQKVLASRSGGAAGVPADIAEILRKHGGK